MDEALQIKEIDSELKVLVLGYTTLENIKKAVDIDISLVVYNTETLKKIVSLEANKPTKVHLKIETGLNRQGVRKRQLIKLIQFIKKHKDKIHLEGVSTHFADIEDTLDSTFAMKQLEEFKKSISFIKNKGFKPALIHCAASAGMLLYSKSHFSMVRTGISLYGLWPSAETRISMLVRNKKISLRPVGVWKSVVAQIKSIDVGESVSYGRTWFAARKSKIAIVPVGYSDGFDRKLSNIGRVIINGAYADVVGRVAMNMIMVDVTDIKGVSLEDEVVLLGKFKGLEVSANEWAKKLATINYEVVSRISTSLPRIII
ncbi:alanine racemase [Patescibacteria group bacterium]